MILHHPPCISPLHLFLPPLQQEGPFVHFHPLQVLFCFFHYIIVLQIYPAHTLLPIVCQFSHFVGMFIFSCRLSCPIQYLHSSWFCIFYPSSFYTSSAEVVHVFLNQFPVHCPYNSVSWSLPHYHHYLAPLGSHCSYLWQRCFPPRMFLQFHSVSPLFLILYFLSFPFF